MDTDTKRIDPPGCGCTDCLTGYSVPVNLATQEQLAALCRGELDNASRATVERVVSTTYIVVDPT